MALVEVTPDFDPRGDDKLCRNCDHYNLKLSECRKNAPIIVMVAHGSHVDQSPRLVPSTRWPITRPDDWCGDFDWRKG